MTKAPLKDLLYRTGIAMRGTGYWHWRYYGWDYRARRENREWQVRIDGRDYRLPTLDHWLEPGRTIHVLLSGPSAGAIEHRERLLRQPSITVNGSHRLIDDADARADLYLVSDVGFVRRQWDSFRQGVDRARAVAVDHRVLLEVTRRDPDFAERVRVYLFDNLTRPYGRSSHWWDLPAAELPHDGRRCAFSTRPDLGFFPSCTVAYLALQIAAAQRPRRIVFFGLDLSGDRRFYAEHQPENSMLLSDFDRFILPDFQFASSVLRRMGIEVVNASPASALPDSVFARRTPESCLGGDVADTAPQSN
ncbi:MAG: hypothetical protein PHP86_13015 [Nevskiales bacterium]|nr:hypothetical protein [Nevskiales bacterium]